MFKPFKNMTLLTWERGFKDKKEFLLVLMKKMLLNLL